MSGIKMAKASEADLEMALNLQAAINALADGFFPKDIAAEDDEYFDEDDPHDCHKAINYLLELSRSASLMRVIFGAAVMLDPYNKLVDPDADTLEHHPETEQAKKDAKSYRSMLLWVLYHHQGSKSDVGQPIRRALGIGQFDNLNDEQIQEAKSAAAIYSGSDVIR
jgi:hypothetical protein